MGNCEDTQLLCDRFERQCFKYKQSIKLILKGLLIMMQGKGMISVNLCSTLLGTWFQGKKKKKRNKEFFSKPRCVSFCGIQGGKAISSGFHLLVSPSSVSLSPAHPIKKR